MQYYIKKKKKKKKKKKEDRERCVEEEWVPGVTIREIKKRSREKEEHHNTFSQRVIFLCIHCHPDKKILKPFPLTFFSPCTTVKQETPLHQEPK